MSPLTCNWVPPLPDSSLFPATPLRPPLAREGNLEEPDSRTPSHQVFGCGQAIPTDAGRQCLDCHGPAWEPLVLWSLYHQSSTTQPRAPGGTTDRSHPRPGLVCVANSSPGHLGRVPRTSLAWRDTAHGHRPGRGLSQSSQQPHA